jgi:hypothetical protein
MELVKLCEHGRFKPHVRPPEMAGIAPTGYYYHATDMAKCEGGTPFEINWTAAYRAGEWINWTAAYRAGEWMDQRDAYTTDFEKAVEEIVEAALTDPEPQ